MQKDLTQLSIKAKAGDSQAFGELYDATFDLICKYFAFRVHDPADAQDLTSQVYMEAWQNISRFDPKRNFSAWIYGFARFRLIDYYRSHKVTVSLDAVTDRGGTTDLQAETSSNLESQRIKAGLNQLPEPYRTVLQLRYLQELEYPEIAQLLGKTESHLRVQVKRGLERLKGIVE